MTKASYTHTRHGKIVVWGRLHSMQCSKREKLIRRIKECQKKIDQNVIIKMFENLKAKVHTANEFGLRSLDK